MRALVFDRPAQDSSATRVASIDAPEPGPGQVAVRVAYAGINFKDVMARRGDPGYAPRWPFVPGVEVVGAVSAVGPGVIAYGIGDLVVALTNDGGLADVAVADVALTVPVPGRLDPARAVTAPGALATAILLFHHVRDGDVVLVHSAGGAVGRALADVARATGGVRLIGVVGAASRAASARAAGYADVLVRGDALPGVDVVLTPQGTTFLEQDLAALVPGGRIVLFGNASGEPLGALPETRQLYARNASIGGFSLEAMSAAAPEKVASAMRAALDMLAAGRATGDPIVVEGLTAAPVAQQALADGTGKGKYVVRL
jgi:NADPH2:quinone reductase